MRNMQLNQQSAMILPQTFDPDTKQPMFSLELLSLNGGKAMDTSKIKEYYKNLILVSLFADILTMGQTSTGSFALGQIKNSLSGNAADSMLRRLCDVINEELIRQTYELNGWDTSRMGYMDYENLQTDDLESFSKAVQRYKSTSSIELDRSVLNRIRESIGVDALPEDMPPQEELLGAMTSRASDGMATAGAGTSTDGNNIASGDANLENVG